MNGQWNWLIGRKLSLGEVIDVFGESATVRHARVEGPGAVSSHGGLGGTVDTEKGSGDGVCD